MQLSQLDPCRLILLMQKLPLPDNQLHDKASNYVTRPASSCWCWRLLTWCQLAAYGKLPARLLATYCTQQPADVRDMSSCPPMCDDSDT